ncbi:hypothetical protein BIFADO_02012 [Bifidobacterium adolescentis L2-32]|uniref:Uncharacterized protein n=1 Tax=Bifidobacterium adolescentis L2-32 TaxID=411481 RepID=A7A822_BIFAD|nr:hypothetical protein BIFADO_02012 [Bifidobacterium adolescentis L2-32]
MRLNFIVFENLDFPTILEIAIVGSRARPAISHHSIRM